MLLPLCITAAASAAIPAVLTVVNLREYQPPPAPVGGVGDPPFVSVCIPARNEEASIRACVESVLASAGVSLEVLVLDDASTDQTASIVSAIATGDSRVRLMHAPPLPNGWNGKQHACYVAAHAASAPVLCFLDADVRLEPEALSRMAALLRASGASLVSGFPREETGTTLEWLLLPLIHFVLLGYLPLPMLRRTVSPGFAAGCGQFLMVDRAAYLDSGGHAAIRETMHDGLLLPRLLRTHGYNTRLADLTHLARCRMYHTAATTWNGLAKNATEGMATPGAIVPFTLLLGLGQVIPVPLLVYALLRAPAVLPWAWAGVVLSYLPRLLEVRRFRQRPVSAALHPVGVATLLALQWYAFGRKLLRRPAQWKARAYAAN